MNSRHVLSVLLASAAWASLSSAWAQNSANDDQETIIVTGTRTAQEGKTSVPLLETPQNIQVLSSDLLLDQGDHLLDEALRNVGGVMPGGYYTGFDYFRIRGFDASGFIYQDGLLYDSGISTNAELFGLDRVEVAKGPSASLYGQGSLGGLVNLVSKRPERGQSFLALSGAVGDFNSYEATLDGGMPLSDNLNARLVVVDRRDGTFTDFVDGDTRYYFAPSLTWDISPKTSVTFLGGAQRDEMSFGFPLPAEGTVFASPYGTVPLTRYNGEPGTSNALTENRYRLGYELRHDFNDAITLHQNLRYSWADTDWGDLLYPAFLDDSTALIEYRYPYSQDAKWTNLAVDTNAEARFSTGALAHTFVAGVDWYHYHYEADVRQIDYSDMSSYMPLDLINPVYGAPIAPYATLDHNIDTTEALGLYAQDHARIGALTLTAGVRWDHATDKNRYAGVPGSQSDDAWAPRVGVTYDLSPDLVAYGSYSESFKPQLGYSSATGAPLDPETGQQWEAGVKAQLFNNRLNATAAVYQLTRQNVATSDPSLPPGSGAFTSTGEQRSRGFEFDSQIVLARGWELVASYSYIDAVVTRDNDVPVGDHSLNVPPQSFAFWTKYEVQDGPLSGLAFSIGANRYASQWGDLPNTFKIPGYTLVNGNIGYTIGHVTAQLNLKNITDERYFIGSYNDLYVNPGAPRSAMFSLAYRY
ncbi:MAG: TonB-dependent siderophore receptor [Pseudomonadota bacterium]